MGVSAIRSACALVRTLTDRTACGDDRRVPGMSRERYAAMVTRSLRLWGANLARLAAANRGTAAIMLLPVALAGTAGAWRALTPGMVSWDFASEALLDSVRGSGPVAAGLAAWITIGSKRSGVSQLELGHRSAAAGPLTGLAIAASAALAGYALTAVAVAAWLGLHARVTGRLQPAEVAAGGAALVAHVTVGFLIALAMSVRRRCPARQRTALGMVSVVIGASWALDAWSAAGPRRAAGLPSLLLSPDVHHSPFTQWRPGFFVTVLTWFCGLVAATVLASGWALTRHHRYAIAFAAASVVAGVGLNQLRADAAHPIVAVPAPAVCRTWPLQVCVNPAFASALPQLELVFTAVAAEVSGTRAAIRSVTQLPPWARTSLQPGGYGFHLDDLGQGYALRAESDLTRQVAAALNRAATNRAAPHRARRSRQPKTADIGYRARFAPSRAAAAACPRHVPYAVMDGLELADVCAQGALHLRPGRAQPP
jgi:hypothetical protein